MRVRLVLPVLCLVACLAVALAATSIVTGGVGSHDAVAVYHPDELAGLAAGLTGVSIKITGMTLPGQGAWEAILGAPAGREPDPLSQRFNELLLGAAMARLPQDGSIALLLDLKVYELSSAGSQGPLARLGAAALEAAERRPLATVEGV